MILKEHKKHATIKRPAFGNFHRNEWAIVGGQCSVIKQLAGEVIGALTPKYKCSYADTSHNEHNIQLPGRLATGAILEYSDEINYRQLNYSQEFNPFQLRELFSGVDMVLVNGNHQQAKAQVIIIDKHKKASLQKRVAQLTNVQLLLLADGDEEVFDFVKETVVNWAELPLYRVDETEKITSFFENKLSGSRPKLKGLVLAGGKSERMGFDKGAVDWHGKEQRYYMADMLEQLCSDVYISCRSDQQRQIDTAYANLPDTFIGLGPFGAILSAFREDPDAAWLVIACDLPLIDETTLQYLVNNRNTATIATAFQSSFNDFPEPLMTIWEPKSYPVLLSFLAQGYSCPRKVLINSDVTILNAPNQHALTNVNTPDEFEKIKQDLQQKITAE